MYHKTSNPVFHTYFWKSYYIPSKKMTLGGVLLKTLYSLFLVSLATWYVWSLAKKGESVNYYIYGGLLIALFFSVLTSYKKNGLLLLYLSML